MTIIGTLKTKLFNSTRAQKSTKILRLRLRLDQPNIKMSIRCKIECDYTMLNDENSLIQKKNNENSQILHNPDSIKTLKHERNP